MPLQGYLTSLGYALNKRHRDASDARTNLLTELINSIKASASVVASRHVSFAIED